MINRILFLCAAGILQHQSALADTPSYSPNLYGITGLNALPNARMDKAGILSLGASTLKPYMHGYLGFQLANSVQINVRQSAEITNLFGHAERLYPGVDTKIRLIRENEFLPEVAIGLNSAIGHQRMASEYLAFSKRYNNFDFTAGIGWGRMAGKGHIKNPLGIFSSHFKNARNTNSEMATTPEQWFTGNQAAFFGGIEYFTPLQGLSLKADWGADNYNEERANISGFNAPAAWSVGLNYAPRDWISAAFALHGTDSIMGRLTFKSSPEKWPFSRYISKEGDMTMKAYRPSPPLPQHNTVNARQYDTNVYGIKQDYTRAAAMMELNPHETSPAQMRRAIIALSDHTTPQTESYSLRPVLYNFKGPLITVNRRDVENALAHKRGSAEEIWHSAEITSDIENEHNYKNKNRSSFFHFVLDNKLSLSEEDSGVLYRSSLITHHTSPSFLGFLHNGTSLRLNLADNLDKIADIRPVNALPVRSNEADFAAQRLGLERSYLGTTFSLTPELHASLSGGYLEEMYGGFGGEILYRPFGKRFAFGAESWIAMKRDPLTTLNLGFNGDSLLTGHVNGWYEFPDQNLTLQARIGRYLAEDLGSSLSLKRQFHNGATLEGFITISDMADIDPFGGTTHAYNGVRLTLPLGNIPLIPKGSTIQNTITQFGRDYGQALNNPMPLYEVTDPLSYNHIVRYWHDITN